MIPLLRRSPARRPRPRRAPLQRLEWLEVRLVHSIGADAPAVPDMPTLARPMIVAEPAPTIAGDSPRPQAFGQPNPWGLAPQQVAAAYGFNAIAFGGIAGDGTGQTIAIVDAYDDPALVDSTDPSFGTSDLAQFDRQYGLPDPPGFVKINQAGDTAGPPGVDPAGAGTPGNWEQEEALDVEWAHALAPGAALVLVECRSSGGPDLYDGVKTAAALPGVSVISMSWGSAEYAGEASYDGDFTTPEGHQCIAFVAAAGDTGAPGLYPAYSPGVLAVGGTTLTLQGGSQYGGESGWANGGGGTSIGEGRPAYQANVQATGQRTIPDVAFDADPKTGVSVYDSYDDTGAGPWMRTGGTSLAAPVWAALIAIADQGRATVGGATLDGATQVLPTLYALPAADFHDVTTGGNGVFEAGPGYDQSTGLGTPVADRVAAALAYLDIAPWLAILSGPPAAVAAGQPFDITVEVENSDGSLDANFIGSVTISLRDNPGGATLGGPITAPVHGGYATFTGLTLTRAAAGYTIVASSGAGPAADTTAPFAVTAGVPAELAVVPSPAAHRPAAPSVAVMDAYGNLVSSFDGSVIVWRGQGWANRGHHPRHGGISATASGGIACFARPIPGLKATARRPVLQADADGLSTPLVFTFSEPIAGNQSTTGLNRSEKRGHRRGR